MATTESSVKPGRANLFYETSFTLILEPDKDRIRKLQTIIFHGHRHKIPLKLQTKSSNVKKDNTS